MDLTLRRTSVVVEDIHEEEGRPANTPLRKVAVIAVIANPFAGQGFVADLQPLVEASVALGDRMGRMAVEALGPYGVQSYGKGGIVGLAGEQEHANALLTTAFANPLREAVGGGTAWISSMTKVAAAGSLIDIPMNHKDEIYVRSHYDGMSLVLPGSPRPDEIAIIFCLASAGRLNARVGGLTHAEVEGRKTAPSGN